MVTAADAALAEPLAGRRHRLRAARLAFRAWRRTRPFWAGVWAMLGGALIAYVPATAFKLVLIANASLVLGVLVGALVGAFGLMLWFARPLRVLLGVLILLLSLTSFFTSDFGGLILGMLMGLVGGSLAISWVPTKVTWRQRRRARAAAAAGALAPEDDLVRHAVAAEEVRQDVYPEPPEERTTPLDALWEQQPDEIERPPREPFEPPEPSAAEPAAAPSAQDPPVRTTEPR